VHQPGFSRHHPKQSKDDQGSGRRPRILLISPDPDQRRGSPQRPRNTSTRLRPLPIHSTCLHPTLSSLGGSAHSATFPPPARAETKAVDNSPHKCRRWRQARWRSSRKAAMRPPSAAVAVRCGCRASFAPATVGPEWQTADHDAPDRPNLLLLGLHEHTKSGIGRPSLASAEKHEIIDGQEHRGGSETRQDARLFDPQTSAAFPKGCPQTPNFP
jgi:hypothetical protein